MDHSLLVQCPDASMGQSGVCPLENDLGQRPSAAHWVGHGDPVVCVVELSLRPTQPEEWCAPLERIGIIRPREISPQRLAAGQLAHEHVRRDAGQVKPKDVDLKPPFVGLTAPEIDDVEITKVDIEVPSVKVEHSSAVHHLTPFKGSKHLTRPAQFFERLRIDLTSVVHGEVPVTVGTKVTTSSGPAQIHCHCTGKSTAPGNDPFDELFIQHAHSVPDECPHLFPNFGGATVHPSPEFRKVRGMGKSVAGRVAIVTGVSRRAGIGYAIARDLLTSGMHVLIQSWSPHDAEQPWGEDPGGISELLHELRADGGRLEHIAADFSHPEEPRRVMEEAIKHFGHVDVLVVNHARSSLQALADVTAHELDLSFAVNVRAGVLLAQAYATQHEDARPGGRVIVFTSGQHLAPMPAELPYAISKGAIHQMTLSLADALVDRGITVNAINPGPTDTGWANPELTERVRNALPAGRWGSPDDASRLVAWLVSDDSAWITGQIINSEGGFRRGQT